MADLTLAGKNINWEACTVRLRCHDLQICANAINRQKEIARTDRKKLRLKNLPLSCIPEWKILFEIRA